MSGDFLIEFILWPIIIGANIWAYYYDLIYHNEHHKQKDGDEGEI